ncbi:MAG TPA: hypothetical protein VHB79_33995 [Polyangiaceae bacterium]|nr:hypothetical protein [Polyangiaceae bacterium]
MQGVATPVTPASGGTSGLVLAPPFGTSSTCGDAILRAVDAPTGTAEECDDGGEGSDACTAACQTRDQPAVPQATKVDRYQGAGRHPLSGGNSGFASVYVQFPGEEPEIGATLFDVWGRTAHRVAVSTGASPIDEANPVVAALPDGSYAVAWSDFDGDGSDLGIALRRVHADGTLGPVGVANSATQFSQRNPDILWTGTQLVVAWEDFANADTGPDLRYRLFDQDLNPLSDDQTLAADVVPESAVALAAWNGTFAAAYREGTVDGRENIVVKAGAKTVRNSIPWMSGPIDDRPALVALDATHLLLAFSVGTDPGATGIYSVPRIRYAVIDTTSPTTPLYLPLDPMDDVMSLDAQVSHLTPALEAGSDSFFLAWRSEARPGDGGGDEIWLKALKWNAPGLPGLSLRDAEILIPRTCEGSFGDQRRPDLARVPETALPPYGALAIAWDDFSNSQGPTSGDPDVVVHYAPTLPRNAALPTTFTESWKGGNGTSWPSYWSKVIAPGATLNADIQSNQGRLYGTSALMSGFEYVNDRSATNLEMQTKVRFNSTADAAGLIARVDPITRTYLVARLGTGSGDQLRVSAMVDGTLVDIASTPLPSGFSSWAANNDFYLKFRVVTDASGTTLSAKSWLADLIEPATWGVTGTLPANLANTSPLYPAKTRLGNASGPFGVYMLSGATTRTATFDDLRVTYLDGAQLGDPTANVSSPSPLLRAPANYRTCTDSHQCGTAQGCCNGTTECQAGLNCSSALSDLLGMGSHAKTCAPDHCTDNKLTAGTDEFRADCGGTDCAACTCASTARGTPSYCTPSCLCGIGDADCAADSGCLPGLRCIPETGYRYGWPQGTDACVPPHCIDRIQDADETGPDTGGSCGPVSCSGSPNGGYQHCTVSCRCGRAEGNCNYNDECQTGMVCSAGTPFGLAFSVCVMAHCTNSVKDADETAKNCGGVDCAPCP